MDRQLCPTEKIESHWDWFMGGAIVMFVVALLVCIRQKNTDPLYIDRIVEKPVHVIVPATKHKVVTTGYHCPAGGRSNQCDKGVDDGITASGHRVQRGVCAADITVYPFGTWLFIPNYGPCEVQDTGRAIKGQRIDLYFTDNREAIKWGKRTQEVIVIDWGNGRRWGGL